MLRIKAMARKAKVEENVAVRLESFKRVVGEKLQRRFSYLFVTQLDKLNDDQWATLAMKCRYKAGDAGMVLALMGLETLMEAAE